MSGPLPQGSGPRMMMAIFADIDDMLAVDADFK